MKSARHHHDRHGRVIAQTKDYDPNLRFTYQDGRIVSHSPRQHGLFHTIHASHTHLEGGGKRVRETFPRGELRKRTYYAEE
jgi:hypothetical protein